jgi:trans-aconitate methyltransferase
MSSQAPAGAAGRDDWDRHWEELGAESAANPAVAYRARVIARLIDADGNPRRILDIGAGVGDFLALAAERWPDAELAGVDVSAEAARVAARRAPGAICEVVDLTRDDQPVPPRLAAWASHAVCSEVLEHVDDPVALARNAAGMLAPGCMLVVTVPSGEMSAFDRHLGHRRHYTAELLASQLREAGLEVEAIHRAGWPFFNLYRAAVRMRGEKLISDAGAGAGSPSLTARMAMAAFSGLFRLNLSRSRWGEQLVAVVRAPR